MSRELSKINLEQDFERVKLVEDAARWELETPGYLEVCAMMYSIKAPEQLFQVRLLWDVYPDNAPSLKFRDPETGRLDMPTAWPVLPGFRPGSLDACVNYCSEGFALHPEWTADPKFRWNPNGNVLLNVLRILQEEFDLSHGGRFDPNA